MKHHYLVAALALLATACTTRPASNQEEESAPRYEPHQRQRQSLPMLIEDWDFTLSTQGKYFKPYLQGQKKS